MQWLRYKALFLANRRTDGICAVRIPNHFNFGRILPQINTFWRKIDFVFILFSLMLFSVV